MRSLATIVFLLLMPVAALFARHRIVAPDVKSLTVVAGGDWLREPVVTLGSDDVVDIDFDKMSHAYSHYIARIERCEPDWTPSTDLFETDWLEGINDIEIDDYAKSLNTTVLYTHYHFTFPNEQCRVSMSGNYRIRIIDDDQPDEDVAIVELRVVEPLMSVGLSVTTNTDAGLNTRYQQLAMTVGYNSLRVTRPDQQLHIEVTQNGRDDLCRRNPRPTFTRPTGLQWEHSSDLIFDALNEYHKFEVLDVTHPTMGLDRIYWDADSRTYHAYPLTVEPARNYVYDEDADGAFIIRNSDNVEIHTTSDYVWVHYRLQPARHYADARVRIEGRWTTEHPSNYVMTYDPATSAYEAAILQKLGYYNYQLVLEDAAGAPFVLPEEGSFFQTENRYSAFVFYRADSDRTWRLVGYQQKVFK